MQRIVGEELSQQFGGRLVMTTRSFLEVEAAAGDLLMSPCPYPLNQILMRSRREGGCGLIVNR